MLVLNVSAVLLMAHQATAAADVGDNISLPPTHSDRPLRVYVGLYFESLSSFQATLMSYDVDAYLYLSWHDARLAHNDTELKVINRKEDLQLIWLPDLYFANARSASFQDVIVPNFSMFISRNGTVAFSTRVMLNVACNLDLQRYPHDEQKCGLKIQSYTYTRNEVRVQWFTWRPVRFNEEINLPEFHIIHMGADDCPGVYHYAITEYSRKEGHFSCLVATLHLSRSVGYHFWQTYVPTGMIVVISWVSFWIDPGAVPARVSLSFTTLLTLSTMGAGLRYAVPPVSYAKSIDLWFGTCMMFVFAALLEYAAVNSYMRQANRVDKQAQEDDRHKKSTSTFGTRLQLHSGLSRQTDGASANDSRPRLATPDSDVDGDRDNRGALLADGASRHEGTPDAQTQPTKGAKYMAIALNIDKTSRAVFPGSFILFLVLYILFLTKLF